MDIEYPKEPFTEIEPFKEWYYEQVSKNVSGRIKGNITQKLPRWTEEEKKYVFQWCRASMPFPKKVILMYAPNAKTLFSYYNESKNKFVIALPTVFLLVTQIPRAAKAGLQHEFGHILNGDCIRYIDPKYSNIANQVYDVAINATIQRQDIDDLYRALFDEKRCPLVPELSYPKWGLPVNETGWSYEVALDAAYNWQKSLPKRQPKNQEKPETYKEKPLIGDIIRVGNQYAKVENIIDSKIEAKPLTKKEAVDFLQRMKKVFDGDEDAIEEAVNTGYIDIIGI